MKKKHEHIIKEVVPGSIAEEMEIASGDALLSINGNEITDIFDYQYYTEDESITVLVRKPDGEEWELEIEKDYDEDLGLVFENGLMDEYRSCRNKCIFCFIDQMPPGMRETLYFKDDDSRLSFLQGNYVTLTNMSDEDLDRMIAYHLSPINVSIHTMNPDLRCKMLNNRFAGDALKKLQRLYEAGVPMNGQIVLCKGVNDGAELEYSIKEMAKMAPTLESVSVVPVGLTKYREGLYQMTPFTKEDAREVLATIHKWQDIIYEECGLHFIHASDEWYLLAEEPLPEEDRYDGYVQLENGVGMLTLFHAEFAEALAEYQENFVKANTQAAKSQENQTDGNTRKDRHVTIATGRLAGPFVKKASDQITECFPQITADVVEIRNDFFGESITVSGLITGQDLEAQLKGKDLGDALLLPCNMLRSGEETFLDDLTATELSQTLQVPIVIVKSSGEDFLKAVLGEKEE